MKKKYLIFVFLITIISVNFLNVDALINVNPASPTIGFNVGDKLEYGVSESFDFSHISFKSKEDSSKIITGKEDMRKIYNISTTNKFTAYCLDGNKKYPEYNYISEATTDSSSLLKKMSIFEIFKECGEKNCNVFDSVINYSAFTLNVDDPSEDTLTKFNNNETVSSKVGNITFVLKDGSYVDVTADKIALALGKELDENEKIEVSFKKSDFESTTYTAQSMPTTVGYKKALWIIENSYPTITVSELLSKANIDETKLRDEVHVLIHSETPTLNGTSLYEAEDYIYATTQYAIWSVIEEYYVLDEGVKLHLGDELIGSEELNKLYKYLIQDRDNYDNEVYKSDLKLIVPEKESYKSETNAEYYGPYKVESLMLTTSWDTLTATVISPSSGVTLVDKDLKELQIVESDDSKIYKLLKDDENEYAQFYIKIDNKAKNTTEVNIKLNVDGKIYNNDSERGRLFYSESVFDQVIAVSAKLSDTKANTDVKLQFNAKTGDINVVPMLLAVLICFSIGYLVLRFKSEPINNIN